MQPLLTVALHFEHDVVLARQRARHLAALLGFDHEEQTRIATAVSEIARNAFQYAKQGKAEFFIEGRTPPQLFQVKISDRGPGIADLTEILEGRYRSATGMGLGMTGARRLVDQFRVDTSRAGTTVWLGKLLPKSAMPVAGKGLADLLARLAEQQPENPFAELQRQNQELLRTLEELRQRQEELVQLNRELEDTNRGVVALYAELDEKADHLRRADELKSRFLSNMSHEFRTPLNSIQALCHILLDRTDGDLTGEQERQVSFIQKAAGELFELVNDLLDLAKIEAGKTIVRPSEFEVATLFSALRGMLRPLLVNPEVQLVVEEPDGLPALETDEGKVSQILRNFLSNALKFTRKGEVRLSAALSADGAAVVFAVQDTGIGIAPEDQERIFQEFTQVEHPIQRLVHGTGLGLPLSKKLAELLGGEVWVESQVGVGSTFYARIPRRHTEMGTTSEKVPEADGTRVPILLIEDDATDVLVYEKYLKHTAYQLYPVRNLTAARRVLATVRPRAILLDVMLKSEDTWLFLTKLKTDPVSADIPVLVITRVEDEHKALALGADAYCMKPVDRGWLLEQLSLRAPVPARDHVLVIDDEESSRYVVASLLKGGGYTVREAPAGRYGLDIAKRDRPSAILLDLVLPDMSGFDVLVELKQDPATRGIPVTIITSKVLSSDEHRRLVAQGAAVLTKDRLGRHLLATLRHTWGAPAVGRDKAS